MTWMNSVANGKPVVPRTGYIVEFNALWYNALCFCADMLEANGGDKKVIANLQKMAEKAKASFVETFETPAGYLFDYREEGIEDWNVRPNQIFAVALDYSPLDTVQQKTVLDFCTRELLTPKGLRTLSPKSGGYNPMYVGPQIKRDYAYHNGTAWPWLGGFYMEACLKVYKRTRLSFVQRQMVGFEDEMMYHATGTISELFDGNPPFHGRGAMAFAMNVAEILRTMKLIDEYNY
jgi:predicted glycogen debranching enzyme